MFRKLLQTGQIEADGRVFAVHYFELRTARGLDDLYHQANARVARITGTTTTSMIAVELMRRSRSADAIGPFGSNTPAD